MSAALLVPKGYVPKLGIRDTEQAIKKIKDRFEYEICYQLNLERISAPLFVRPESGLNDNLNGVERPVEFDIRDMGAMVQVVHSLAKWKRAALKNYGFAPGTGLYTDMNAIRRDEELDNLHSVYVDQWDWELVITRQQRTVTQLKTSVTKIFRAMRNTQNYICNEYKSLTPLLADEVFFITSQELEDRWPDKTPKEREKAICQEKRAVFIMQIGDKLKSGIPHDLRAPDYDDWQLNGDLLVWNDALECALELSSMGIRVDEAALLYQLGRAGCEDRRELPYHKALLAGELPCTIGGGIGQSRLCMQLLEKAHVGEVQASVWPDDMLETCKNSGIALL